MSHLYHGYVNIQRVARKFQHVNVWFSHFSWSPFNLCRWNLTPVAPTNLQNHHPVGMEIRLGMPAKVNKSGQLEAKESTAWGPNKVELHVEGLAIWLWIKTLKISKYLLGKRMFISPHSHRKASVLSQSGFPTKKPGEKPPWWLEDISVPSHFWGWIGPHIIHWHPMSSLITPKQVCVCLYMNIYIYIKWWVKWISLVYNLYWFISSHITSYI